MKREITCVLCPKGCLLIVDTDNPTDVSGNSCKRGLQYGHDEIVCPKRTVCSTVSVVNADIARLPIKTSSPIPREKMRQVMREVMQVSVNAPVQCGDVVIANVADTGADVVATRTLAAKRKQE